ncbi:MAG: MmcB family DNA repair protein [Alphaproteobacteria bacterium]|nr:MmcB family DNA repair protein [Alphaproteobacteria bacterium]
MTLVPPSPQAAELTRQVTRGVCRALVALDHTVLTEFTLPDGRRADVIGLGSAGELVIIEVKVSVADLLGDDKWPDYLAWCDRLYFAAPPDFPHDRLPANCGVLVADAWGAEELRPAPDLPIHASRRRALLLRFARHAARRLHHFVDPRPA